MQKIFRTKNWQIILFNIILVLCFILGYGRFGDVIVDTFREAYIPEQMLNGQILYKNIFNIYPPLAYMINALLFMIFGIKLKVLYFAGFMAAAGVINLTFKIASKFMAKTYSLGIVLFFIAAACLSPNVFNLFCPYSFGILYGILFILASLYCALKSKYTAAYILYSLAICTKYEFIFLFPALIWISGNDNRIKNLLCFFFPIFIIFGILFLQGLNLNDISVSFQWITSMLSSKTLYWFYSVSGLVFRPQIIPIYLINFAKYFIPLMFVYYFRNIWVILLLAIYLYFAVDPEILIYIFPLIFSLTIIQYKKLSVKKRFIILSSLLLSAKLFFALTLKSYGVFFIPFALIPLFILIPKRFKKSLLILVITGALILGYKNLISLANKSIKVQTDRGVLYTSLYNGIGINVLINYIQNKTGRDDRILILPECLSVNFLTDRKSDNKFYSLIPLYVETFGEKLIIDRLKFTKPEYIVISNYDTSNYYYSYFGQDYAGDIFDFIIKNYTLDARFGQGFVFNVFKLKK